MTDESPGGSRVCGGDRSHKTGPALEAHLRFLAWLIPAVERFPRSQKFLLGDRIQNTALDVCSSLHNRLAYVPVPTHRSFQHSWEFLR